MSNRYAEVIEVPRDFSSSAYQRIAAGWAEKIDKGVYADGHQLPTRQELVEEHGVSLQVIRDALHLLHTEGYVRSEPGRFGGTFVSRPPVFDLPFWLFEAESAERDSFDALVEAQGYRSKQEIDVEILAADDPDLPEGVGVEPPAKVLARRRVRSVWLDGNDGWVPYAISDSFYPYELVRDTRIADPADIARGARHVLAEGGFGMDHHVDRIVARRPHLTEVRTLDIAPGLSVLAHTRISYTKEGRPIRVLASVLPSDRWRLTYEVR